MNVILKQHEPKEVKIGEVQFYIRPFSAFTAANISGEVISILSPLLSLVVPFAKAASGGESNLDVDLGNIGMSIPGDKLEKTIRKLLVDHRNIAVDVDGKAEILSEDLANEIFCGEAQYMYLLAFEVIKINFPGIFDALKRRFGNVGEAIEKMTKQGNTATSTLNSLATLS